VLIREAIIDDPSDFTGGYYVLVAQNAELVRDSGVISTKTYCQVTDTQFTRGCMQERVDDLQAGRITQNRKKLSDAHGLIGGDEVAPNC